MNTGSQSTACVHAVAVSTRKGIPKSLKPRVLLRAEWGIEGDVHAGAWHRQVSLLALESIEKMRARGLPVRAGAFAENITTEGITLTDLVPGDRLRIGAVELEITQIGKECHTLCAIAIKAGDCVMPREGIFARVLAGGEIEPGAMIETIRNADQRSADQRGTAPLHAEPAGTALHAAA